jgi:hypothetical protein
MFRGRRWLDPANETDLAELEKRFHSFREHFSEVCWKTWQKLVHILRITLAQWLPAIHRNVLQRDFGLIESAPEHVNLVDDINTCRSDDGKQVFSFVRKKVDLRL